MNVAFSRPTSDHSNGPPPPGFHPLANEALLSAECAQRFFDPISELMVRFVLIRRILRQKPAPSAVVTGRYGDLFALLRAVVGRRWAPLILLDVEWHARSRNPVRHLLSRAVHRLIADGACAIQVFCEAEVDRYAACFGIPRDKFVWIPFCTDLDPAAFAGDDGDYVFTGGYRDRDYRTLFAAIRDLPVELRIAGPRRGPRDVPVPDNVRWLGTLSKTDYYRQISGARFVVLSLTNDEALRFPGVITYVVAMHLGKCVVLNEPVGSASYLTHGVHGLVVPPRDPAALHAAMSRVLADPGLRDRLGGEARAHAVANLSIRRYRDALVALVRERIGAGATP